MSLNIRTIEIGDPVNDASRLRAKMSVSDEQFALARDIIENVGSSGDRALLEYTQKFDGVELDSLAVTKDEIKRAYRDVEKSQIEALRMVKRRLEQAENAVIEKIRKTIVKIDGTTISKILKPVESVGCYVPGGKARYPSTVIMCAVPAMIAGVKRIIVCSPPTKDGSIDPLTLVAADICGLKEVYKVGGAQAIAAMAYGTDTIRAVSKIAGPGGPVVTAAKALVSKDVSIDMLAGPTELLVFADEKANTKQIALDMISQTEHSTDTLCGLVTCSRKVVDMVKSELSRLIKNIERKEIVSKSLEQNGFLAHCRKQADAIRFINEFAPEHLQIMTKNFRKVSSKIESSGLVLVGEFTPSAASDYGLGTNHVLPTLAFAKSRASLSCLDFAKMLNFVETNKKGLKKLMGTVEALSRAESLPNHYQAIMERFR